MRVAFVGKGGSGKTTLTTVLTEYLALNQHPVMAIDADINQHLIDRLNFETKAALSLSEHSDFLKSQLINENKRIAGLEHFIKTTPPGRGSKILDFNSPLLEQADHCQLPNLRIFRAGQVHQHDLGAKCYHSVTGAVEILLNHLNDHPNEFILVDMTAGADSFASGIFTKFDAILIAVAPNQGSIDVFNQHAPILSDHRIPYFAIANQLEDQQDLDFIAGHIQPDRIIATIYRDQIIKEKDRGQQTDLSNLSPQNLSALQNLRQTIQSLPRDWTRFRQQSHQYHLINAQKWANQETSADLQSQIDPLFTYPQEQIVSL